MAEILIVGAGIFGTTAAVELRQRGWDVTLLDQGTVPYPRASSTDISKVIRPDYGEDASLTRWMLEALEGWRRWNRDFNETLYHEVGFLMLSLRAMGDDTFEGASWKTLLRLGESETLHRASRELIARCAPVLNSEPYEDGYLNARAGWAASGRVVEVLAAKARGLGVEIVEHAAVRSLLPARMKRKGVIMADGSHRHADAVLIAGGAWTSGLVKELRDILIPNAQQVVHLRPADPAPWKTIPVVAADISSTGWYFFPAKDDGAVKIANHGIGENCDPRIERSVGDDYIAAVRRFCAESLPGLADAELAGSRVCWYADTWDGNFYIDRIPGKPGFYVASGGSGHGFKFAPVLGALIADAVEGKQHAMSERFRWRPKGQPSSEAARATA